MSILIDFQKVHHLRPYLTLVSTNKSDKYNVDGIKSTSYINNVILWGQI